MFRTIGYQPENSVLRITKFHFEQAVGGRPPRYAAALQACSGDTIRHVRIWIGHHYCMSVLACQYNQPKWPGDFDLLTLKVVSGAWGYCVATRTACIKEIC